jgi:hypothetical protein
MWISLFLAATAQGACTTSTLATVAQQPAPAVLVLGERRGMQSDASRALRLVKRLRKKGPVTLAIQAVPVEHQPDIDAYEAGALTEEQLALKLNLGNSWGFDGPGYQKLIRAGKALDINVVAAGVEAIPAPATAIVPVPPAYMHVLGDPMGEHPIPVELEGRYTAMVAYVDHRVALRAVEAWGEQGYLVIFADRLHVEGSKGISWQATMLTSSPALSVLLKASDTPCYSGDIVLR